jgi:hypothetical protein
MVSLLSSFIVFYLSVCLFSARKMTLHLFVAVPQGPRCLPHPHCSVFVRPAQGPPANITISHLVRQFFSSYFLHVLYYELVVCRLLCLVYIYFKGSNFTGIKENLWVVTLERTMLDQELCQCWTCMFRGVKSGVMYYDLDACLFCYDCTNN